MKMLALQIALLLIVTFIGSWWYFSAIRNWGTVRAVLFAKGVALSLFFVIAAIGLVVFS